MVSVLYLAIFVGSLVLVFQDKDFETVHEPLRSLHATVFNYFILGVPVRWRRSFHFFCATSGLDY